MSTPIVLTDVGRLPEQAIQDAVRHAFAQMTRGRAVQPPQVVTDIPGGGDVIAYQAVLADEGVYAVKVSPYLPQSDSAPIVTAWTLLLSTRTGEPLLLVDSKSLTTERTAATTALAIDRLARPDATRLALIGLGPVGRAHLRHAQQVRRFTDIHVWSPTATSWDGAGRLAASPEAAVDGADVVMLCTSAAQPVIDVTTLAPGTLVTSISTNAPLAHEIDPVALRGLEVYADHTPAAFAAAGEMRIASRDHGFGMDDIRGDLAGACPPPSGDKVVFFRSVGLGIEDAAVALAALKEQS